MANTIFTDSIDITGTLSDSWSDGVCVFCGSSLGTLPEYKAAADSLGLALARRGYPLIYGGGTSGLMGVVAAAVISEGEGRVWGVIPTAIMARERSTPDPSIPAPLRNPKRVDAMGRRVPSPRPGEGGDEAGEEEGSDRSVVTIVNSMHERKTLMSKLARRAFIVLPGGYGTLEELLEMATWCQLNIHRKPVVVISVASYYAPLKAQISTAIEAGFITPDNSAHIRFVELPSDPGDAWNWGEEALKVVDAWYQDVASETQGLGPKLTVDQV